jgi:hypothetical protein
MTDELRAKNQALYERVKELRAALKVALDGWAVWVFPDQLHPERPDSITDAEMYDQEKITDLRTRHL